MGRPRRTISDKPLDAKKAKEYEEFVRYTAWPIALRDEEFGFSSDVAFAKRYKVSKDTLSIWKGRTQFYQDVNKQLIIWGRGQTPNVMAAMYRKVLRNGDAAETRLWLEYFENMKSLGSPGMLNRQDLKTMQDLTRALLTQEKGKTE